MDFSQLRIKIFADGADLASITKLAQNPLIKGFTTNPTLMRKAGITDYAGFAQAVLRLITDRPISFEVFSDEFEDMERQALIINSWAENVYVKIPITNTRAESAVPLIHKLSQQGLKLNITAMTTLDQVKAVGEAVRGGAPSFISVFAGRIADTGCDPLPMMIESLNILKGSPGAELLWASPRELLNIVQADAIGCPIITVTHDLLAKLGTLGKDLEAFSLDTVKMFYQDAQAAGFHIG
ncbi:MAG: transaldolase [Anaerolineae bacterium]|nr:transaldolase [Anaerolineae bacterium]